MPEMRTGVIINVSKRAEDGVHNAYEVEVMNVDTGDDFDFYFDNWDECRAKVAEFKSRFSDVTIHLFDDDGVHRNIESLPAGVDLPPSRPGISGPADA
ncbi:MAG: hypothetical protein ACRDJ2_01450 [Actinomycetota bacterium]